MTTCPICHEPLPKAHRDRRVSHGGVVVCGNADCEARADETPRKRFELLDVDAGTTVDPDVDLADFVVINDLEPEEVNRIGALDVGKAEVFGGGAAPLYALRRTE